MMSTPVMTISQLLMWVLPLAVAMQLDAQHSSADLRRTPVVEVFAKTHKAVVNISSTRMVEVRKSVSAFDYFFEDLDEFLSPRVKRYQSRSVGSGFVIHKDGYIVTNAHVVARTSDIKISFDDELTYDAQVMAIDPEYDLALLKIEPQSDLEVIKLGRSDDLLIGETVIAIGNPLGYQHTLTTGVISATNRDLELINRKTNQPVTYANLIQTDASINPGNSGGPLLNVLGELIGINTAIRGDAQNIGFAIPVNTLKQVLPEMLKSEQDNRMWFGASIDAQCAVTELEQPCPAASAGLAVGDVILQVNDTEVRSNIEFYFEMIGLRPGNRVRLIVERDGVRQPLRALLQERPRSDGGRLAWQKMGVRIRPLTSREARQRQLPVNAGLLITDVEPNSPAEDIRMRRGDVLTVLGRWHVNDLDEVGLLLEHTKPGDRAHVEILRTEGHIIYRDGANLTLR